MKNSKTKDSGNTCYICKKRLPDLNICVWMFSNLFYIQIKIN